MHELILGGQRSGKSRCAELRALAWLAQPGHSALLIATARPGDEEMRNRISRHQDDRARRLPTLAAIEVPQAVAHAVSVHSTAECLIVVDCLTLWLTNLLLPAEGGALDDNALTDARKSLCRAVHAAPGPVVLVSNEIGLGVIPLTSETRRFVDELGWLHQAVAAVCESVTLLVAGIELPVKRSPPSSR